MLDSPRLCTALIHAFAVALFNDWFGGTGCIAAENLPPGEEMLRVQ